MASTRSSSLLEHDQLTVLVPGVLDAGLVERSASCARRSSSQSARSYDTCSAPLVEERFAVGFVDETVGLVLVLLPHDERRAVPRVRDAVLGEELVDGEALHRLELLEVVRDLFLVLGAELFERERTPVGQRHQAVGALEHAGDVFRPAQHAPARHGREPDTSRRSSQHVPT